ncbi:MAG: hypothetical protein U0V70_20655 [Terriglobia bacterium]
MGAITSFTLLLILWGAITAAFIGLMIWKSLVGMREEDQIFLDDAEAGFAKEQREIIDKVRRITTYAKGFGFTSAGLLLIIAGIWVYRGLYGLTTSTMP